MSNNENGFDINAFDRLYAAALTGVLGFPSSQLTGHDDAATYAAQYAIAAMRVRDEIITTGTLRLPQQSQNVLHTSQPSGSGVTVQVNDPGGGSRSAIPHIAQVVQRSAGGVSVSVRDPRTA